MKKSTALFTIVLMTMSFYSVAQTNVNTFTFGIVPQQSAQKLVQVWQPLFQYVEEKSDIKLRFRTAPNIPEFEKRTANSEYDFVYMNPYHFTVFNENPGYQALAKAKDKKIKGIMVVPKNSTVEKLEDLDGKEIAFPAPAAFAASVLPRAIMKTKGIDITPIYVQTHDSVYLTIMRQRFVAGGGVMRTFKSMPEDVQSNVKVLWTTPGYTPHAIAGRPGITEKAAETLLNVLLDMAHDLEAQDILTGLKISGFEAAKNEDWDDVRALNIDLL